MKVFIVASALFAVVMGAPSTSLATTIIAAQSPILSQYHSQDALGQYAYGYNGGSSAKIESKSLDGITRGSYSYVDPEGLLQTVEYTADAVNGFRAAATNLPNVRNTPEAAFNEAAIRAAAEPEIRPIAQIAPTQVVELHSTSPGSFSYTINTPPGIASSWFGTPVISARTVPIALQLARNTGPQDTPEVALAKTEHFRAVEEQKARIAATQ